MSNLPDPESILPEKQIVFFSPHFDDMLFCMGGFVDFLKTSGAFHDRRFHVHLLFSRSNYQARDDEGNRRTDRARVQFASGVRLIEDQDCLDELLGHDNYVYQLHGYQECFTRGKPFADSEMEFPHGMFEDFDDADRAIYQRLQRLIGDHLPLEDSALVFPIAIKEHIDHFILREAAIRAVADAPITPAATIYFIEDKPYGGIANDDEMNRMQAFIAQHNLEPRPFPYRADAIIEPAFRHYVSQVEDVYRKGVQNRARTLGQRYFPHHGEADCLYYLPTRKP